MEHWQECVRKKNTLWLDDLYMGVPALKINGQTYRDKNILLML